MATRPTLPYFAPSGTLPAPLPTIEEIAAAQRISKWFQQTVVRVRGHYAVKFGPKVTLQEGENMLFVGQSTNIPVPKVYALFTDEATGLSYIVMDYIPGRTLITAWRKLSATEKSAATSQLRRHLDELRSIPSPGYYGGIWGQPTQDSLFMTMVKTTVGHQSRPHPEPEISGPHETEEQWADGMCRCLGKKCVLMTERKLALLRQQYHGVFKGHKPVFTHGDLFRANIILQNDGTVVLIDWQRAGWYPSFWEYCRAIGKLMVDGEDADDDWANWAHETLSEHYPAEFGWMVVHEEMFLNHP